jgi:hypothetical protein
MRKIGLKRWIIAMLFVMCGCVVFLFTWNIYFFVLGIAGFIVTIITGILNNMRD